jgi:hypothetical protein
LWHVISTVVIPVVEASTATVKKPVSWGLTGIAGMAGLCAPSISIFSSLQTIPNGFFEFKE